MKKKFDYTGCTKHVVQEGESLFDIAQHYCVALQQLRYFNNVSKADFKVYAGKTIYIPKAPINVPVGE
ncbi:MULTISPECIES: LysM domain-containing protein [Lactobacillus]|uniref:LysM domain-containing protein n=1 Tax=Lactobacillus xujianguonis TaxID=2495899 RepID=A0A437STB4_9LACO|nr:MULTISPECIES: LysM domain-containing protein [Lactobacillus]RVU70170.1 LysM domain-containing protein [Lactobacillus xujianguonis]RVU73525.1 LysM domain-containing protein [Lactobacillus xujianguonis]